MPPTRHTRREGRDHSAAPIYVSVKSVFAAPRWGLPFRSNTSSSSDSTEKEKEKEEEKPDVATLARDIARFTNTTSSSSNEANGGTKGFSTDTTPFFLRRVPRSRHVDDVVQRGLDASTLLGSIANSMNLQDVGVAATSAALVFDTVQSVRTNRTACLQMLERVHQIVRAIINLCGDARGMMAPMMARAIEQFTRTLIQLHAFLRTQAAHGLFARIVRHAETRVQLQECADGLAQAVDLFGVQTGLITNSAMGSLRKDATARHAELLRALGR
ncbi:hypothetical protein B0H17DRAFT_1097478 [Mycena rosella]|uniref:Uncharacterized protein n=1 Tax=Mycena rosella TaxID=1033263 RepID=A0AAD7G472_MYCRO|nr:hypothetical protein B0H17DRAFT_1097478 [Mycena rosella]